MKRGILFAIGVFCLPTTLMHARKMEQPVPGRITLTNATLEDIDVYFYTTTVDRKTKKSPGCTFIQSVPPHGKTTVEPKNCWVNVIEVRHTPEEDYERVTKEFLSAEDQQIEKFFEYQGPNMIVEIKYKGAR